ncbi:MAG: SDR family oxidoreductase [Candidatus Limiplasma sp.]|nr:SDR family oxidoreductase [Candidatus Limiplasma sp.]
MGVLEKFRMDGKKGFITGAGQGIGKALAEGFAEAGAEFAVVDINLDNAKAVAQELGEKYQRRLIAVHCDVTKPESVDAMMAQVLEAYGTVDFAINNAGIVNFFPLEEVKLEDWKKVLDVNLIGVMLCAQAAAKVMIAQKKKGTITNMASMSAHIINIPQTTSSYCTSKAAVVHLTKSMAVEWAKYGIRVNCVSPGYISNELNDNFSEATKGWIEATPQKRMGKAEELCGAYLFLASDASSYATGTELVIDGGYTIV